MKNLSNLIFNSPKRTDKKEKNPKKMDQDRTICKNFVDHLLSKPQIYNGKLIIGLSSFQEGDEKMGWQYKISDRWE
jgi:hypothetical protein